MTSAAHELSPHQYALCDLAFFTQEILRISLWDCQARWLDLAQSAIERSDIDGMLLLASADHGKTSRAVIPLLLWLHARDHNHRIIFAMNKDEFAEQVGRAWARRIERQKILREEYGLVKGDKWAGAEYLLQRDNWDENEKDSSLLCLGVGSEIQSQRADVGVLDDAATRRNSQTVAMREKLQTWVFTDFMSRLDFTKGAKCMVFGHRVDPQDVYSVMEDQPNWLLLKDPAIISDIDKTILAPEGHTYERLARMRANDPIGFSLLYQQMPVATGIHATRSQFEKLKNKTLTFHPNIPEQLRCQFVQTWLSLDPAFSVSKHARYAVWLVWGIHASGHRQLIYGLREKCSAEQLTEITKTKIRIYDPDNIFIEGNAAQSLLIPPLRKEFPHKAPKIQMVMTLNPKGQLDEEIINLFSLVNAEPALLDLPYGCTASQSFVNFFEEEVVNYPGYRYRDVMMSWYIGEKGMGFLRSEVRRTTFAPRGVVGAVSDTVRARLPRYWR